MAWSPMAGGRLFAEETGALRFGAARQEMAGRFGGAGVDQLVLAWIMAHPARPMPVLGTGKQERVKAAAAAVHLTLTREDWYGLWEAAKGHGVP